MEKPKQIILDALEGKKLSRWDCSIWKKELRAELKELENKIEAEIESARESL